MRAVLSVLSLLVVVAAGGWLVKKQMASLPVAVQMPTGNGGLISGTPQQHSQQLQNQVKKTVEEAMQTPRPVGGEN
jgi:hypothetical protein